MNQSQQLVKYLVNSVISKWYGDYDYRYLVAEIDALVRQCGAYTESQDE